MTGVIAQVRGLQRRDQIVLFNFRARVESIAQIGAMACLCEKKACLLV